MHVVLTVNHTYSELSGMGGSGLIQWYLLPTKNTLQVRPHIFVEDTVKEKYTNTLQEKKTQKIFKKWLRPTS